MGRNLAMTTPPRGPPSPSTRTTAPSTTTWARDSAGAVAHSSPPVVRSPCRLVDPTELVPVVRRTSLARAWARDSAGAVAHSSPPVVHSPCRLVDPTELVPVVRRTSTSSKLLKLRERSACDVGAATPAPQLRACHDH